MKNKKYVWLIALLAVLVGLALFAKKPNDIDKPFDNPTQMRYVSFGDGEKTMVIVPGISTTFVTDNGAAIEAGFSQFTDDFTVYLFDVGADVPEDYSIPKMAEDLVAYIKDLGLKDIYLYGCSMGGMECVYIAGTYPELVAKAVIASSAYKANDALNGVLNNWISLAKNNQLTELTDNMGQLIYSQAVYEANQDYFKAMADVLTPELLTRFINSASAMLNFDLTKEVENIKCPVLILGSYGDKVQSYQASIDLADKTKGEIYLYPEEYPHAVYDEAPDFRDRVLEFYNK